LKAAAQVADKFITLAAESLLRSRHPAISAIMAQARLV